MKDTKLTDKVRLQHILDALQDIWDYTKATEQVENFAQNKMLIDACLYKLEVIGEASNRLSAELQAQYPSIEWAKIVGLRNLIIHEYFKVSPALIWQIIHQNLPTFEAQIKEIVKDLNV
jgi:uncharacterized protein with HEPN domain